MSLMILRKNAVQFRIGRITVSAKCFFGEFYAALRHKRALKGLIGLKTDDLLQILVDITGIVGGDGGDHLGVAGLAALTEQPLVQVGSGSSGRIGPGSGSLLDVVQLGLGGGVDVGADIFHRGLCLPSDIKMTAEEQEIIIQMIRSFFG